MLSLSVLLLLKVLQIVRNTIVWATFHRRFSDKNFILSNIFSVIKEIIHCLAVVARGECFNHAHGDMEKRFTMKAKAVLGAVLFLSLLQSGNELLKASVILNECL